MTWTFHKVMLKLHLWIGLAAAIFLLIVGGTGTILEFDGLTGNRAPAQAQAPSRPGSQLIAAVRQAYPGRRIFNIGFPMAAGAPFSATLFPPGHNQQRVCVDSASAVVIPCPEFRT